MENHRTPIAPSPTGRPARAAHGATRFGLPLLVTLTMALAACGPEDGTTDATATAGAATTTRAAAAPAPRPAGQVGTVTAVVPIVATEQPTGAGAVVGGVLGAAVGNQIGDGNGRKVATVLGALGGAKVGHEVERRRSEHVTGYRVDVKLDNGGTHSVTLAGNTGYSAGQRVRLVDGQLAPA
ncbi:MAG: glycine zipper 2TM domain-containing protein [Burkholderiaceae bacterium]|nr:glycine zipper 2TM domain-containing protein [Rhodoferax sp.]MCP5283380.1 glycine zipper 2TM domain-containing protein [Burkholderiaceae bacterium]